VELGGTVQLEFNDKEGGEWIVMQDPEGNEFCVC
jgi:predicted enzyme related to lactoylglutathione lyase